ncbi:simple sugar transport system substrate-binding protein [Microbacterium resistens]|uniref:Simple sugar transport system substrate-binding protein n=1 Tax=Microbacterium resistens TaxID=156977 RepID=A0ABU1SH15_9MICO|nr:sugar ABC transporter substrate-binding protein [Microbacterium resistens]MDR6868888.1 simple sugar transport system substrate-binding protein [Microbacterium resistens]
MKKRLLAGIGLAAAAIALAGCSGTGQPTQTGASGGGASGETEYSYAVITHSAPGDAFWDRVKSGAEKAGADYHSSVLYNGDPDPAKQSQLIDNAVAQKVNGIVVSMANPDGLKDSVERAIKAGIPVVTINSGMERSQEFGAITHIGQSESVAGKAVGERLASEGVKKVLCVIHEAGNVGLEERCASAKSAFSGTMENIQVDGTNDAEVKNTLRAKLQSDPSIDGVLTLGGQYAIDAVGAVSESGSKAGVATFDLSSDVITQIEDGKILFAVDQQPYVQGFLGITALYLDSINGNIIGGGQPVYSGPAFVTKENAAAVAAFAENGTR